MMDIKKILIDGEIGTKVETIGLFQREEIVTVYGRLWDWKENIKVGAFGFFSKENDIEKYMFYPYDGKNISEDTLGKLFEICKKLNGVKKDAKK